MSSSNFTSLPFCLSLALSLSLSLSRSGSVSVPCSLTHGFQDLVQAKQDLEEATAALAEAPTAETEPPILADAPVAAAGQLVMDEDTDMPEEPTLQRVVQPFLERSIFRFVPRSHTRTSSCA